MRGESIVTPVNAATLRAHFLLRRLVARAGQLNTRKIPQPGPSLAGLAAPQQHAAIGELHDDRRFVHHPRTLSCSWDAGCDLAARALWVGQSAATGQIEQCGARGVHSVLPNSISA